MTRAFARLRPLLLLLLVAFAPAACATVRLVGAYDEKVDQAATQLQRQMDAHLTRLESLPAGDAGRAYAPNQQFYLEYGVDLRALEARVSGLPGNTITTQQIDLMEGSLEQLRSTHQTQNNLSTASIGLYRTQFNTAWRAILAFELAKKR